MSKDLSTIFSKKRDEPISKKKEVLKEEPTENEKRTFIIVTQDFTGLGWAKRLQDEGNDVVLAYKLKDDEDKVSEAKKVGKGIVPVMELDEVISKKESYKKAYWIFDMNFHSDVATELREGGYKTFGAQEISEKMENDRQFASDLMAKYGIKSPPTQEFSSIEEGVSFLESNEDKAYVFKPDDQNERCYTFVPDNEDNEKANNELRVYMGSLGEAGKYILQERIKGVETNFECWFFEGKPFFAFCNLECKKKLNNDFGGLVGCSQSIDFAIPLESKAVKTTIAKLYDFYKELKYTGFVDANIIVYDNENYYLETCNRFGYNAHPSLLFSVAKNPVGQILADFIDGKINDIYDNFRFGFSASITLYTDDPKPDVPLFIDEKANEHFYLYDGYKKDDQLFLTGYCPEIGVISAHGYTIKEAAENVLEMAKNVRFPLRGMRSDIDKNDYGSAPQGRHDALEAMDYFEK